MWCVIRSGPDSAQRVRVADVSEMDGRYTIPAAMQDSGIEV